MNLSPDGAKLIKHSEGCQLIAYPDPATGDKPWTCGYGQTGPEIFRGIVWSQAYADRMFDEHAEKLSKQIEALITVPVEQCQFDAIVSLAYNVGVENVRTSTLLRKLNAGDYDGAGAEFIRWNRAAGKIMRGLTRRRYAERALFEGQPVDEAIRIGAEAA